MKRLILFPQKETIFLVRSCVDLITVVKQGENPIYDRILLLGKQDLFIFYKHYYSQIPFILNIYLADVYSYIRRIYKICNLYFPLISYVEDNKEEKWNTKNKRKRENKEWNLSIENLNNRRNRKYGNEIISILCFLISKN